MLCGSHFCPFSPISQVEQWPQSKRAATYQAKCSTRLLSAPTELEFRCFLSFQGSNAAPWWLSQFLVSERVLFGTWDGVFTSCLINIFGVIVFLRSGWIVAEAGIVRGEEEERRRNMEAIF
jgi:hypothetical protein